MRLIVKVVLHYSFRFVLGSESLKVRIKVPQVEESNKQSEMSDEIEENSASSLAGYDLLKGFDNEMVLGHKKPARKSKLTKANMYVRYGLNIFFDFHFILFDCQFPLYF